MNIEEIKKQIIEALKKGKKFSYSTHEGGWDICFDGKNFTKNDFGDYIEQYVFCNEQELLKYLYEHYQFKAEQKVLIDELEKWNFIKDEIYR